MTEVRCGNCGGTILRDVMRSSAALICPRCSAAVPVGSHATVSVAEAVAGMGSTVGLDPYRTGTIVIEGGEAAAPAPVVEAPAVEVKVKGFLTQQGLGEDEADHRLRGGQTTVGRREGEILIDDPSVSGRHFQIEERGGQFYLRDLGSSNGTFVNDRAVRQAPLQSGDRIQAGSTVFTFSVRHTIPT